MVISTRVNKRPAANLDSVRRSNAPYAMMMFLGSLKCFTTDGWITYSFEIILYSVSILLDARHVAKNESRFCNCT